MRYFCDYNTAIKWCHNSYIQFDEIWKLDEDFGCDTPNIEDVEEIFQTFMSDCSDDDVNYLKSRWPRLIFIWSYKFEKWFLAVDHWGTSWDYVSVQITKRADESEQDFLVCVDIIKSHAKKYFFLED